MKLKTKSTRESDYLNSCEWHGHSRKPCPGGIPDPTSMDRELINSTHDSGQGRALDFSFVIIFCTVSNICRVPYSMITPVT